MASFLARLARILGKTALFLAVVLFAATVLLVRYVGDRSTPWDPDTTSPPPVVTGPTIATSTAAAVGPVTLAAEACPAGYDRDRWFDGFTEATRNQMHAVPVDGWTGRPLTDADRPQIDHVVPVREAVCSGLDQVDADRFYNDVGNLTLTAAAINAAKSDLEPGEWTAPTAAAECRFAAVWVDVKARWQLTYDPAEHAAVATITDRCTQENP